MVVVPNDDDDDDEKYSVNNDIPEAPHCVIFYIILLPLII
jgi:hypothetical protein